MRQSLLSTYIVLHGNMQLIGTSFVSKQSKQAPPTYTGNLHWVSLAMEESNIHVHTCTPVQSPLTDQTEGECTTEKQTHPSASLLSSGHSEARAGREETAKTAWTVNKQADALDREAFIRV